MMSEGDGFLSRWSKRKLGRGVPAAPPAAAPPNAQPPAEPPSPSAAVRPADGVAGAVAAGSAAAARGDAGPSAPSAAGSPQPGAASEPAAPAPLPTLDDVSRLTRESDYSPFVNPRVDPQVRNAAMKKLFSDPHFNVMDGLDTYIDDYGKPDPLPLSMLRQMSGARALGLFVDEDAAAAKALAERREAAKPGADSVADPVADPAASAEASPDAQRAAQAGAPDSPPEGPEQASPDGAAPAALAQSHPEEIETPHEDTDLRLQPDDAPGRRRPDEGAGRQG
jgi:Protein of unknown function (DUF3306)